MVPTGASLIWNHNGTAPGLAATLGECQIYVMPGVPKEMKAMFTTDILPLIRKRSSGAVILQTTLHTFGVGESTVAERLGTLMMRQRNPSVGTTVSGGIVSVRINARFDSLDVAKTQLDATIRQCESALGDLIFGSDDQTLAEAVAKLLRGSRQTVTTAESCTGGLLAKYLTDVSGSSDYFKHGWIVYSNEAKQQLLGVSPQTLAMHGAVSEAVVRELATNALNKAAADYSLAISGVAGPTGGTDAKPVGTVCVALASRGRLSIADDSLFARTFAFPGDRQWVRDRSAKMALTLLRYAMLNRPLPF
jgi:nicotinamide-nucleotide amidase